METTGAGDRVTVESERVGEPAREGVVVEVISSGETVHYRIRWDDGHESTFFPSAGSLRTLQRAKRAD